MRPYCAGNPGRRNRATPLRGVVVPVAAGTSKLTPFLITTG
ncbi:hypothetical protein ACIA5D_50475 [Actinoplanes sp. NPDC051513]